MKKSKMVPLIYLISIFLNGQSTDQINQAKKIAKSLNLSKTQITKEAKARGYTDKQIEDVLKENNAVKSDKNVNVETGKIKISPQNQKSNNDLINKNTLENKENISTTDLGDQEELPIIKDEDLEIIDEGDVDFSQKEQTFSQDNNFFGYDIFNKDPEIFQSSSFGAVDPNYLISPGDEIIVMLWGETQFRQVLKVNREGFIFIPDVGQVFVNGLNLNMLESKLYKVLSQSYESLNSDITEATTFLDVSLGDLRPLRIQVLGEINQPGAYTVNPSTTLFTSLYYFNGPSKLGSLRDIKLFRGGDQIANIDFYDFLLTGKMPKDEKLQLDDVIFIPKRGKTVHISGEVNKPGIYELKDKETLSDIISMAGELKITAYLDRAQIDRIVPFNKRAETGMDRIFYDVNLANLIENQEEINLMDGDKIQIFSVLDTRQNIVFLKGAVTRPGQYDLGKGLYLKDLIIKADSLLGDAYLERIDIVRLNPDFTEKLIKLNLDLVMRGDYENNILLKSMDQVRVYSMTEMIPRTFVSITGHAKNTGKYVLQENMTVYDLIFKAGGYIDEEFKKKTYLKRAELIRINNSNGKKEIVSFDLGKVIQQEGIASTLLKVDDQIRIYSNKEIEGDDRYVSIIGHVKRPGRYELFQNNMTLYDLIFKSGGFEDKDFRNKTYLKRAELIRKTDLNEEKEIIPFNLDAVLNQQGLHSLNLKSEDIIKVYSIVQIKGETQFVNISGHVKRPGKYELYSGNMTLYDLIFNAGGFEDPIFFKSTYLNRADLIRYDKDQISQTLTSFNLSALLKNDNPGSKVFLEPNDRVIVYSKNDFKNVKNVIINGSIKNPGKYNYKSNMDLKSLILEAGGTIEKYPRYFVEVAKLSDENDEGYAKSYNILLDDNYDVVKVEYLNQKIQFEKSIFELSPFDLVSIRPDPFYVELQTVSIVGEVKFPGDYTILHPDEKISDLIRRAGGLKLNAYPEASIFKRNNEIVNIDLRKIMKRFNSKGDIKLQKGDYLIVNKSPDIIIVDGEVNAPGIYTYTQGHRINDVIREAGGLTDNALKSGIFIKFPNGKSEKYNRFYNNPKIMNGSKIIINTKPEEEPFNLTEYLKESTAIAASLAQTISIIYLATRS